MEDESEIQLRIYGPENGAVLVYLPGLHGDWTLIGSFRQALAGRVRFVEVTYPRTLSWTLPEYAEHVEEALLKAGITGGWLLGESFSSQVVWALLERKVFRTDGVVLAGGFVRHPAGWGVRLAGKIAGRIPLRLITAVLFGYAKVARLRFRKSPQVAAGIHEFIERRTELDRQAAVHRLDLIFQNDPCDTACEADVPIYAITGILDPIVPWVFVRSWLKRNCPALRDYVIVRGADHNVLGTAPKKSAEQILEWMRAGKAGIHESRV